MQNFDPDNNYSLNNGIFGLPFDYNSSKLIIFSAPWDVTCSYRAGTSNGPESIFNASFQLDLMDADIPDMWKKGIFYQSAPQWIIELNKNQRSKAEKIMTFLEKDSLPLTNLLSADLIDVNNSCRKINDYISDTTNKIHSDGKISALVGGEHSVAFHHIKEIAAKEDEIGIIQIDAHADLRKSYMGFEFSHSGVMRQVAENVKNIKKIIQLGVRDFCKDEFNFSQSSPLISTFYMSEISRRLYSGETIISFWDYIVNMLPEKVYLSVDIDGFDPSLCQNTGTPVPGGFQFYEFVFLLKALLKANKKIVGFDLCEVAQRADNEWDAIVGARVLYQLCIHTLYMNHSMTNVCIKNSTLNYGSNKSANSNTVTADESAIDIIDYTNEYEQLGLSINKEYTIDKIEKLITKELYISPLFKKIIFLAKQLNIKIKFSNKENISNTKGIYSDGICTIFASPNDSNFEYYLLHELIHSVTKSLVNTPIEKLTKQQQEVVQLLKDLYKEAKNNINISTYGLTDINEFIAELSNLEFRKLLQNTKSDTNQFLWDKIKEVSNNLFNNLLDKSDYILSKLLDIQINNNDINKLQTSPGDIHGFEHEGKIGLFTDGLDISTPVHEYTHLWDSILKTKNKALWDKGKSLMKSEAKSLWDAVANDENYGKSKEWQNLSAEELEDKIATEVHSKLSGGAYVKYAEKKKSGIIAWLKEAFKEIANVFGWSKEQINNTSLLQWINMPIADFVQGGNILQNNTEQKPENKQKKNIEIKRSDYLTQEKKKDGETAIIVDSIDGSDKVKIANKFIEEDHIFEIRLNSPNDTVGRVYVIGDFAARKIDANSSFGGPKIKKNGDGHIFVTDAGEATFLNGEWKITKYPNIIISDKNDNNALSKVNKEVSTEQTSDIEQFKNNRDNYTEGNLIQHKNTSEVTILSKGVKNGIALLKDNDLDEKAVYEIRLKSKDSVEGDLYISQDSARDIINTKKVSGAKIKNTGIGDILYLKKCGKVRKEGDVWKIVEEPEISICRTKDALKDIDSKNESNTKPTNTKSLFNFLIFYQKKSYESKLVDEIKLDLKNHVVFETSENEHQSLLDDISKAVSYKLGNNVYINTKYEVSYFINKLNKILIDSNTNALKENLDNDSLNELAELGISEDNAKIIFGVIKENKTLKSKIENFNNNNVSNETSEDSETINDIYTSSEIIDDEDSEGKININQEELAEELGVNIYSSASKIDFNLIDKSTRDYAANVIKRHILMSGIYSPFVTANKDVGTKTLLESIKYAYKKIYENDIKIFEQQEEEGIENPKLGIEKILIRKKEFGYIKEISSEEILLNEDPINYLAEITGYKKDGKYDDSKKEEFNNILSSLLNSLVSDPNFFLHVCSNLLGKNVSKNSNNDIVGSKNMTIDDVVKMSSDLVLSSIPIRKHNLFISDDSTNDKSLVLSSIEKSLDIYFQKDLLEGNDLVYNNQNYNCCDIKRITGAIAKYLKSRNKQIRDKYDLMFILKNMIKNSIYSESGNQKNKFSDQLLSFYDYISFMNKKLSYDGLSRKSKTEIENLLNSITTLIANVRSNSCITFVEDSEGEITFSERGKNDVTYYLSSFNDNLTSIFNADKGYYSVSSIGLSWNGFESTPIIDGKEVDINNQKFKANLTLDNKIDFYVKRSGVWHLYETISIPKSKTCFRYDVNDENTQKNFLTDLEKSELLKYLGVEVNSSSILSDIFSNDSFSRQWDPVKLAISYSVCANVNKAINSIFEDALNVDRSKEKISGVSDKSRENSLKKELKEAVNKLYEDSNLEPLKSFIENKINDKKIDSYLSAALQKFISNIDLSSLEMPGMSKSTQIGEREPYFYNQNSFNQHYADKLVSGSINSETNPTVRNSEGKSIPLTSLGNHLHKGKGVDENAIECLGTKDPKYPKNAMYYPEGLMEIEGHKTDYGIGTTNLSFNEYVKDVLVLFERNRILLPTFGNSGRPHVVSFYGRDIKSVINECFTYQINRARNEQIKSIGRYRKIAAKFENFIDSISETEYNSELRSIIDSLKNGDEGVINNSLERLENLLLNENDINSNAHYIYKEFYSIVKKSDAAKGRDFIEGKTLFLSNIEGNIDTENAMLDDQSTFVEIKSLRVGMATKFNNGIYSLSSYNEFKTIQKDDVYSYDNSNEVFKFLVSKIENDESFEDVFGNKVDLFKSEISKIKDENIRAKYKNKDGSISDEFKKFVLSTMLVGEEYMAANFASQYDTTDTSSLYKYFKTMLTGVTHSTENKCGSAIFANMNISSQVGFANTNGSKMKVSLMDGGSVLNSVAQEFMKRGLGGSLSPYSSSSVKDLVSNYDRINGNHSFNEESSFSPSDAVVDMSPEFRKLQIAMLSKTKIKIKNKNGDGVDVESNLGKEYLERYNEGKKHSQIVNELTDLFSEYLDEFVKENNISSLTSEDLIDKGMVLVWKATPEDNIKIQQKKINTGTIDELYENMNDIVVEPINMSNIGFIYNPESYIDEKTTCKRVIQEGSILSWSDSISQLSENNDLNELITKMNDLSLKEFFDGLGLEKAGFKYEDLTNVNNEKYESCLKFVIDKMKSISQKGVDRAESSVLYNLISSSENLSMPNVFEKVLQTFANQLYKNTSRREVAGDRYIQMFGSQIKMVDFKGKSYNLKEFMNINSGGKDISKYDVRGRKLFYNGKIVEGASVRSLNYMNVSNENGNISITNAEVVLNFKYRKIFNLKEGEQPIDLYTIKRKTNNGIEIIDFRDSFKSLNDTINKYVENGKNIKEARKLAINEIANNIANQIFKDNSSLKNGFLYCPLNRVRVSETRYMNGNKNSFIENIKLLMDLGMTVQTKRVPYSTAAFTTIANIVGFTESNSEKTLVGSKKYALPNTIFINMRESLRNGSDNDGDTLTTISKAISFDENEKPFVDYGEDTYNGLQNLYYDKVEGVILNPENVSQTFENTTIDEFKETIKEVKSSDNAPHYYTPMANITSQIDNKTDTDSIGHFARSSNAISELFAIDNIEDIINVDMFPKTFGNTYDKNDNRVKTVSLMSKFLNAATDGVKFSILSPFGIIKEFSGLASFFAMKGDVPRFMLTSSSVSYINDENGNQKIELNNFDNENGLFANNAIDNSQEGIDNIYSLFNNRNIKSIARRVLNGRDVNKSTFVNSLLFSIQKEIDETHRIDYLNDKIFRGLCYKINIDVNTVNLEDESLKQKLENYVGQNINKELTNSEEVYMLNKAISTLNNMLKIKQCKYLLSIMPTVNAINDFASLDDLRSNEESKTSSVRLLRQRFENILGVSLENVMDIFYKDGVTLKSKEEIDNAIEAITPEQKLNFLKNNSGLYIKTSSGEKLYHKDLIQYTELNDDMMLEKFKTCNMLKYIQEVKYPLGFLKTFMMGLNAVENANKISSVVYDRVESMMKSDLCKSGISFENEIVTLKDYINSGFMQLGLKNYLNKNYEEIDRLSHLNMIDNFGGSISISTDLRTDFGISMFLKSAPTSLKNIIDTVNKYNNTNDEYSKKEFIETLKQLTGETDDNVIKDLCSNQLILDGNIKVEGKTEHIKFTSKVSSTSLPMTNMKVSFSKLPSKIKQMLTIYNFLYYGVVSKNSFTELIGSSLYSKVDNSITEVVDNMDEEQINYFSRTILDSLYAKGELVRTQNNEIMLSTNSIASKKLLNLGGWKRIKSYQTVFKENGEDIFKFNTLSSFGQSKGFSFDESVPNLSHIPVITNKISAIGMAELIKSGRVAISSNGGQFTQKMYLVNGILCTSTMKGATIVLNKSYSLLSEQKSPYDASSHSTLKIGCEKQIKLALNNDSINKVNYVSNIYAPTETILKELNNSRTSSKFEGNLEAKDILVISEEMAFVDLDENITLKTKVVHRKPDIGLHILSKWDKNFRRSYLTYSLNDKIREYDKDKQEEFIKEWNKKYNDYATTIEGVEISMNKLNENIENKLNEAVDKFLNDLKEAKSEGKILVFGNYDFAISLKKDHKDLYNRLITELYEYGYKDSFEINKNAILNFYNNNYKLFGRPYEGTVEQVVKFANVKNIVNSIKGFLIENDIEVSDDMEFNELLSKFVELTKSNNDKKNGKQI